MDLNALKERVPMPELARWLGFEPNRGGFIRCPFHDERTASLKLYDGRGGWSCYGCGKSGDQIDFLRLLHRLNFKEAKQELARIAGVSLDSEPARRPVVFRERQLAQKAIKQYRLDQIDVELGPLYREYAEVDLILDQRPASWDDMTDEFVRATHREPHLKYEIEGLEHERNQIDH